MTDEPGADEARLHRLEEENDRLRDLLESERDGMAAELGRGADELEARDREVAALRQRLRLVQRRRQRLRRRVAELEAELAGTRRRWRLPFRTRGPAER